MVRARTFREDLYYRLNVFEIRLPSLAARRDDIYALANHFVQRFGEKFAKPLQGISPEVRAMFRHYSWPGTSDLLGCSSRADGTELPRSIGP